MRKIIIVTAILGLFLIPGVSHAYFGFIKSTGHTGHIVPSFKLFGTVPITQIGVGEPTPKIRVDVKNVTWERLFTAVLPEGWRLYALNGDYLQKPLTLNANVTLLKILDHIARECAVRFVVDWRYQRVLVAPTELPKRAELRAQFLDLTGQMETMAAEINTHQWPGRSALWKFFHCKKATDERCDYFNLVARKKQIADERLQTTIAIAQLELDLNRVGPMHFWSNDESGYVDVKTIADSAEKYNVVPLTGAVIMIHGVEEKK